MPRKEIILTPSRSYLFWYYVLGITLIPLLGIGFIVLYLTEKKYRAFQYLISNQTITSVQPPISETIDLASITGIDIKQNRTENYFTIGTLILKTETKTVELPGINNPGEISAIILKAAEAEQARLKALKETPKPRSFPDPGTIDKLDYLTGLWQQGLISNEDYLKEKKHFEQKDT